MGLFDFTPEQSNGLLDFGTGMLAASGPSRMPVSLGQTFASGMQNMRQAEHQRTQNKMALESLEMQKAYKTMQERQMQMAMDQQARQTAMQEGLLRQLAPMMGGQPQQPPQMGFNPSPSAGASFDMQSASPETYLKPAQDLYGRKQRGEKLTPDQDEYLRSVMSSVQPTQQQAQQGDPGQMANLSARAQLAGIKGASGLMDLAKFNKPDMKYMDGGGRHVPVNMNSMDLPVINKTMTPGEIASNQVAQGNLAVSQFNSTKPTYHDGALVSPTGEVTKTPMYAPPKGSHEAAALASSKMIPLLDQADKLLNDATGGYLGTGVDVALGAFGASIKGAQAGAQLKALEGSIMMAQPRMEGPQSDKDVDLYRQMAAQLGDSTVPVETRRAALKGIRDLHDRYTGGTPKQQGQPDAAAKTVVKRGVYGGKPVIQYSDGSVDYAD